jgi:hypothetical protein
MVDVIPEPPAAEAAAPEMPLSAGECPINETNIY